MNISNLSVLTLILGKFTPAPMASKSTPKKVYKNTSTENTSRCRLCNGIQDPRHCKNLFNNKNQIILKSVASILGEDLPRVDGFPSLICRPCERRVNNTISFKNIIIETQKSLLKDSRSKRCVEISPSVLKPSVKVAAVESRRRSLTFDVANVSSTGDELSSLVPIEQLSWPMHTKNVETASMIEKANKELVEVARRTEPSVLRQRSFEGMAADNWMSDVKNELSTRCPVVNKILSVLLDTGYKSEKKEPALCLIYGIIMYLRCHELSRIQRINSILLTHGQAPVNLIDRLNKYGICLHPRKKYNLLDDIGQGFLEQVVELVKSGYKFVFVLDNIDWDEKVHDMRKDNQNKSVHAMATTIVFNRIPDEKLPDVAPQQDLRKCNVHQLVKVNVSEMECIRKRYCIILQNLLFEHFPFFSSFQNSLSPLITPCRYFDEMSEKSKTFTMPIVMKDEKKYAECVDLLDQLEHWTHQIYTAAGMCHSNESPHSNSLPPSASPASASPASASPASASPASPPVIQLHSRPDQPGSHVPPTSSVDDPLHGVRVPIFGDQLTRVRLAGAKDLRVGCHTAQQRFDHLYPICIVDWHTKRSYLKSVFKRLYKSSVREKGTIRYFREKLNRRNVTADVKHFEDCEQLFMSIGKCFIVEALLEFFQMADTKQAPLQNAPSSLDEEQKNVYIITIIEKFLDEYVFSATNDSDDATSRDGVYSYAINLIVSFLLLADFKDAVKSGNGDYLAVLRKQLLVHFFSTPGYNEFAIEMLTNILQCQVLLTEQEAHQCKWAATVNWNGGSHKNIEIDLFQENQNSEMKKMIKAMGANKSENAISRASRACTGVRKIVESYEAQVNIHRRSSAHSHQSALHDENIILEDLRDLRPFKKIVGREFESFENISASPTKNFNSAKFQSWIDRHTKNILLHYPVFESDDEDDQQDGIFDECGQ